MEQYDYEYDDLNQLVREDILVKAYNTSNVLEELDSKTVIYSYDLNGNIKFKRYYEHDDLDTMTNEIKYIYDSVWKDQLKSVIVNENTINFTYDGQGNPTKITGLSNEKISLVLSGTVDFDLNWEGRQLKGIVINNGAASLDYTYNDQGYRTSKTINGVKTEYVLDGDKVLYESNGTKKLYYTYDIDGTLISFNYTGNEYFYVRNLQGDIVKILDASGNVKAEYYYDAWGNILNYNELTEIAKANPYRYRGYRYDDETSLYYLNSRYYNPKIGRFINADGLIGETGEILSHNMYAYAKNNPVMRVDPSGYDSQAIFSWGMKIAATLAVADGPLPFGDTIGLIIAGGTIVIGGGYLLYEHRDEIRAQAKELANAVSIDIRNRSNTGAYVITFVDGNGEGHYYVGKGSQFRMYVSTVYRSIVNQSMPTSLTHFKTGNQESAYMLEYILMAQLGYTSDRRQSHNLYNKKWDRGRQMYYDKYGYYHPRDRDAGGI
jgi:RHS repeat-associated protein